MTELMTVGYEGLTPAQFLDLLRRCRVERIVDVRELATSRRRGFSKTALSHALAQAGIDYTHIPELGCPRKVRHDYRDDQNWARYTKRFCCYLATQSEALAALSQLVRSDRCCLLCFEEDFNFCHRNFVARELFDRMDDLKVSHLTGPIQGRVVRSPVAAALAAA